MPIVTASRIIAAPRRELFDISQDYYIRREWDPFVRDIEFLDGAVAAAPGVKVRVKAKNRLTMVAEYISVKPPQRVAIKMVEGPWFFEHFAGTWSFETAAGQNDATGEATEVCFRYSFQLTTRLGRELGERLIAWMFHRDIRARLAGLARYAEARFAG